jgi:Siphovirus Gp157
MQMSDEARGPGPSTIERCISAWQRARASLADDETLAEDEAAIATALGSDPFHLHPDELLRRIVRALTFAQLREIEARELVGGLKARQARYQRRAEALRTELFEVMVALNKQSFSAPNGTISMRSGVQSVVITDEGSIPDQYMIVTRSPDRKAILSDLREGVVIEGCAITNGAPSLQFRRQRSVTQASIAEIETDAMEPEQE